MKNAMKRARGNIMRTVSTMVLALCVAVVFAGCDRTDPRAAPIAAETPEEFTAWKNAAAQKIPASEMREFDSCINEIRLGIMQRKEASGSGPIARKLCGYINGKTMREALVMGHRATVDWVSKELAFQRANIQKTEAALNGPGSVSSKKPLLDYLMLAKDNVAKLEARSEKAGARLAELQASP